MRNKQYLLKKDAIKLKKEKVAGEQKQVIDQLTRSFVRIQKAQREKIDLARKLLAFTELNYDSLSNVVEFS